MDPLVRPARSCEVNNILELGKRVLSALASHGQENELAPLVTENVENAILQSRVFVYESMDAVVGCAFVKPVEVLERLYPEPRQAGLVSKISVAGATPLVYLHSIMVEPTQQGNKIGSKLVTHVCDVARERYLASTILLDCFATNARLRRFYESLGFCLLDVIPEMTWEIAVFVLKPTPNARPVRVVT
jgi:GNAT superfamily N-acetyltransferase